MLAITRKSGQRIMIGDNIVIWVNIRSEHLVTIGIDAPPHLPVHREEILTKEEVKRIETAAKTKPKT